MLSVVKQREYRSETLSCRVCASSPPCLHLSIKNLRLGPAGGVQHLSVTVIPMAMPLPAVAATQDHAREVTAAPPAGAM